MRYFIVISFALLFSKCNLKLAENINICDNLDLSTAKVDKIPFVGMYSEYVKILGNPINKIDSCSSTAIQYKQGYNYYDCIEFKKAPGITFNLHNDTLFIASIDFEKCDMEIDINNFKITKETTIESFKSTCSSSEIGINRGASMAQLNGFDWLYLKEVTDNRPKDRKNEIEIWFDNNTVTRFFYDWQPSYSQKEWNTYLKARSAFEE